MTGIELGEVDVRLDPGVPLGQRSGPLGLLVGRRGRSGARSAVVVVARHRRAVLALGVAAGVGELLEERVEGGGGAFEGVGHGKVEVAHEQGDVVALAAPLLVGALRAVVAQADVVVDADDLVDDRLGHSGQGRLHAELECREAREARGSVNRSGETVGSMKRGLQNRGRGSQRPKKGRPMKKLMKIIMEQV